jgi:hypothetical protein
MARYAAETSVPVDRSRSEIERLIKNHGAKQFLCFTQDDDFGTPKAARVDFFCNERQISFRMEFPALDSDEVSALPKGKRRSPDSARTVHAQVCRQRWRALLLCIKAKLESAESGIETFEQAFLAQIVIPGTGQTVAETLKPQLTSIHAGRPAPLLLTDSKKER